MLGVVCGGLLATASASAEVSVLENKKTLVVDCSQDGVINLVGNHISATLSGECSKVSVTGNHATVKGSAAQVFVSGNNNTLTLDGTDEIAIAGSRNTVSYRRPLKSKAPNIANSGKDNKVSQER